MTIRVSDSQRVAWTAFAILTMFSYRQEARGSGIGRQLVEKVRWQKDKITSPKTEHPPKWDFETGDRRGALVRLGKTEVRNF